MWDVNNNEIINTSDYTNKPSDIKPLLSLNITELDQALDRIWSFDMDSCLIFQAPSRAFHATRYYFYTPDDVTIGSA